MNLTLEIITPEKVVYKNEIDELVAPTVNGQIAILPNHVGLITKIIPGELIIRKANSQQAVAVTGGFLEVAKNHISILADYAIRAEDIEVAKAQEAQKRAWPRGGKARPGATFPLESSKEASEVKISSLT